MRPPTMDDLPNDLRRMADFATDARPIARLTPEGRAILKAAADEIERLRDQITGLLGERDMMQNELIQSAGKN